MKNILIFYILVRCEERSFSVKLLISCVQTYIIIVAGQETVLGVVFDTGCRDTGGMDCFSLFPACNIFQTRSYAYVQPPIVDAGTL